MAQHISTNDLRVYLGGRLTEPWSSSSITGLITKDFLENVKKQFALLDSTTKIRVLFAFLGLSKNALKDLEVPILEICDLCQQQSFGEEWLVFMGQFIRSFVSTDDQRAVVLFHEMLQNEQFAAIYQSLKAKLATAEMNFYPLVSAYLDPKLLPQNAAVNSVKHQHFTVKKSAAASLALPKPSATSNALRQFSQGNNPSASAPRPASGLARLLGMDKKPPPKPTGLNMSAGLKRDPVSVGIPSSLNRSPGALNLAGQKKRVMLMMSLEEEQALRNAATKKAEEPPEASKPEPKPESVLSGDEAAKASDSETEATKDSKKKRKRLSSEATEKATKPKKPKKKEGDEKKDKGTIEGSTDESKYLPEDSAILTHNPSKKEKPAPLSSKTTTPAAPPVIPAAPAAPTPSTAPSATPLYMAHLQSDLRQLRPGPLKDGLQSLATSLAAPGGLRQALPATALQPAPLLPQQQSQLKPAPVGHGEQSMPPPIVATPHTLQQLQTQLAGTKPAGNLFQQPALPLQQPGSAIPQTGIPPAVQNQLNQVQPMLNRVGSEADKQFVRAFIINPKDPALLARGPNGALLLFSDAIVVSGVVAGEHQFFFEWTTGPDKPRGGEWKIVKKAKRNALINMPPVVTPATSGAIPPPLSSAGPGMGMPPLAMGLSGLPPHNAYLNRPSGPVIPPPSKPGQPPPNTFGM